MFCTRNPFETEAEGNSELAHWLEETEVWNQDGFSLHEFHSLSLSIH